VNTFPFVVFLRAAGVPNKVDANGSFAQDVRRRLAQSLDDKLLVVTARALLRPINGDPGFDPTALARDYFKRALELNPQSAEARRGLLNIETAERLRPINARIDAAPADKRDEVVASLSVSDQFLILPNLAEKYLSLGAGWDDYAKAISSANDKEVKRLLEQSHQYASRLIELAHRMPNDPAYGTSVFRGNIVLGAIAFRRGDTQTAAQRLTAARQALTEEPADSSSPYRWLCNALLRAGERDTVIEFLKAFGKLPTHEDLLQTAEAIRNGRHTL
jgi:tetratricopeptide (TPR) repeat protein